MTDTTQDAVASIAQCLVDIGNLPRGGKHELGIGHHTPKVVRALQQTLYLLKANGPMLPDVRNEWEIQLDMMHDDNEQAALILLINSILMGLKLYQHPELAFTIHSDEDTQDEQDHPDQD